MDDGCVMNESIMTTMTPSEQFPRGYECFARAHKRQVATVLPLYDCACPTWTKDMTCPTGPYLNMDLSSEIEIVDGVDVSRVELEFTYHTSDDHYDMMNLTTTGIFVDVQLLMKNEQRWMMENDVVLERTHKNCFDVWKAEKGVPVRCPETMEEWSEELERVVDVKKVYERLHLLVRRLRYSHLHQMFYEEGEDDRFGFHAYMYTLANDCVVCTTETTHKTSCNHHLCRKCHRLLEHKHPSPQCPMCRRQLVVTQEY